MEPDARTPLTQAGTWGLSISRTQTQGGATEAWNCHSEGSVLLKRGTWKPKEFFSVEV